LNNCSILLISKFWTTKIAQNDIWALKNCTNLSKSQFRPSKFAKNYIFDLFNTPKFDFTENLSGGNIKFPHLTSYFEHFWSKWCGAQCGNCRNSLSHFFDKSTFFLYYKLLKSQEIRFPDLLPPFFARQNLLTCTVHYTPETFKMWS